MQYTSDDALAVAENKILMLYILEKVKKDIAYKVYLELVTTLTEINYFVFHETLEELIEEGYITYNKGTNKSKKAIYDIVEKIKNDDVIDGCFVERNVVEFDEDKKELETQETQENLLRQKGEFDEVNYCVVDDVIDEVTDEVASQKASNNKRLRTL